MKIVIPMAGAGGRFLAVGYKEPKPLIKVDGKPLIQHVVEMFPGEDDFLFLCNRDHFARLEPVLRRLAPRGKAVPLEPHKLGPVHTVLQAEVADDGPVVVNYCDFSVEWDWPAIKRELESNGCDGAVPAYRGFHPHSLGTDNYAYMRERGGWMLDIQEKKPFTSDRMSEFASSGTYYFKSGALMKRALKALSQDAGLAINGEHYVSLAYKFLDKVWIPEVRSMLQWGTPQDLEEYQGWSDYFRHEAGFRPAKRFEGQALIPAAGLGLRFKEQGWKIPKPAIEVGGKPMLLKAADSLPQMERRIFVLPPGLEYLAGQDEVVAAKSPTRGQAETCLLAKGKLDMDAPLLIGSCDSGLVWDEEKFAKLDADFVAFTAAGHVPARRKPEAYGWVDADAQGGIKAVSVKKPLGSPATDPCVTAVFWYRKAGGFVAAAEQLIAQGRLHGGEFYADAVMQVALERGLKGKIFNVGRWLSWGTPEELRTWEYWEGYFARN